MMFRARNAAPPGGLYRWFTVLACLLAATGATAQSDASPDDIETIVVPGEALSPAALRAPTTFATVLDTELYADHVKTVSDALAESVGTQVRRFGGLGAFSTVSIRGSSAKQVQIYLDGVPLSRANNETVNLADLPIDSLERIEVYRGQTPVGFGAGAIGGVVNLVTAPPSEDPTTELRVAYGSFDTAKVVASHSQRLRGFDVLGHASYLHSDGDFTFEERSTAPGAPPDPITTTRRNNDLDSVNALLKASRRIGEDLHFDFTSEGFFKEQGVPGIGRNQSDTASLQEARSLNYAGLTRSNAFDRPLELGARLFGVFQRTVFDDHEGDLFGVKQDVTSDDTVLGTSFEAHDYASEWHQPSAFFEVSREGFLARDDIRPTDASPDQTRLRVSTVLQEQFVPWRDRVRLIPTLRYEHLRDTFGPIEGQLGREDIPRSTTGRDLWGPSFGVQVRATDWLWFNGNIGRFERAPNLDELFGNRGFVQGNPKLRSEEGINRDIGLRAVWCDLPLLDEISLEYAYFNNDVDDLIILVQLSQQVFRPENIGGARLRGHELGLHLALIEEFTVDLNYTRQDAENLSEIPSQRGKQLPGRPRDELYLRAAFDHGPFTLSYELNHIAENFLDRVNFRRVDARDLHALGLALRPVAWLRLGVEARNLTDQQTEDVAGFPLPGRSFFGTIKVSL